MGLLRFLLASAVVLGHAPGWGWVPDGIAKQLIAPYYAVQAFFVISGFYMAMIYGRYAGHPWIFYTNRYTRLAVPYLIVAALTLALAPFPFWPDDYKPSAALVFVNLTMFGLDTLQFFQGCPSDCIYWIVPQAWSIGTEICFYLLVPLLAPARTRTLCGLLAVSVLIRLYLASTNLPFFPWQQRFFPAELMFFLVGMLAFRFQVLKHGLVALAGCAAVVFLWPHTPHVAGSLALAAILFFLVPAAFNLTNKWRADRFIGEFSYPVYLWHVFVGSYFAWAHGWLLLLVSVLFSIPVVLLVEKPLEAWRAMRLSPQPL